MEIFGVVLAAGLGKRMKSKLHKVLHPVCGKPLVGHVVDLLEKIEASRKFVIVGHGAEAVQAYLGDAVEYVFQAQQLGTGHAVLQAKQELGHVEGITIVIYGDAPLVREETLRQMIDLSMQRHAAAVFLTARVSQPFGLGRIIRDDLDQVLAIVEQKDCSESENQLKEINAGTYVFDNKLLFQALEKVKADNRQQEYYLTDVISIMIQEGKTVVGYCTEDSTEAIGINDRIALAEAEGYMRERILRQHMANGVTVIDPMQTFVDQEVVIGMDTVIMPGCVLRGKTTIGEECVIGPHTEIVNSQISDRAHVKQSVLNGAIVGCGCTIGPFAYLRPGTKLGVHVKIGDFVEIKNASIGDGSKVSHLSYVGDASMGKNVNFGCGAITVNYNGYSKQLTDIEDDAFIGSNVNLIAPVKIGKGAYVVAGSTITDDVAENEMAIARQRQTNKPDYAVQLRQKFINHQKNTQK